MTKLNREKATYLLWGVFDLIYVLWYAFWSYRLGKVPYYTDMLSSIDVVIAWGGKDALIMLVPPWLLEMSIIVSAVMLLTRHAKARLLCYIQAPFRVILVAPSVSLIVVAGHYSEGFGVIGTWALLLLSEAVKVYTLWKFTGSGGINSEAGNAPTQ